MSADTITAICALVVAVAALVLSIYEAMQRRRHDRLSVTPHLDLIYHIVAGEPVYVELANVGVGPAVVRSFELVMENGSVHPCSSAGWRSALSQLGIQDHELAFRTYDRGDTLAAGAVEAFLRFPASHKTAGANAAIVAALKLVQFRISYSSVYGTEYQVKPPNAAEFP